MVDLPLRRPSQKKNVEAQVVLDLFVCGALYFSRCDYLGRLDFGWVELSWLL
jgi:hypothetical protein